MRKIPRPSNTEGRGTRKYKVTARVAIAACFIPPRAARHCFSWNNPGKSGSGDRNSIAIRPARDGESKFAESWPFGDRTGGFLRRWEKSAEIEPASRRDF